MIVNSEDASLLGQEATTRAKRRSRFWLLLAIVAGLVLLAVLLVVLFVFVRNDSSSVVYDWELLHVSVPLNNGESIAVSLGMPRSPNTDQRFPVVAEVCSFVLLVP